MQLSEFPTLAEAQAHFVLGRVNKNDFANHDATYDIERILDDTLALDIPPELHKVVRVFRKIINGLLDDPNVGDSVTQAALTALVHTPDSTCAYTQVMRDHLEELSKTYPHANATQAEFDEAKDTGEIIALNQNNSQHTITVNITTQPLKPTGLKIQQRLGADNLDMTEWHEIAEIRKVYYTQRPYKSPQIPASPTAYRELRLVSPLTLGVSIV